MGQDSGCSNFYMSFKVHSATRLLGYLCTLPFIAFCGAVASPITGQNISSLRVTP